MKREFSKEETLVITLGGNAVLPVGKKGTIREQFDLTRGSMKQVSRIAASGARVVLSHGNGPIVGNIVIRNECASHLVPPMPLFICDADSQGGIGFMIQNSLVNELHLSGQERPVVSLVTQVEVHSDDPAFMHPSKPIGPFYRENEAKKMKEENGWDMMEDSGRGWRRVVPSPEPVRILELDSIRILVDAGVLVIAAGGGGIPVRRNEEGVFKGVDAVVDKDLSSEVLCRGIGASTLVFATSARKVALHYGSPKQKNLDSVSLQELKQFMVEGHFPPGSMGPKMEAARRFLEWGGKEVIVCVPEELEDALDGNAGTRIHAEEESE
ncbi:MAG: carbamate kinase [Candidatus Krumholzibacteria bacterium]|nr:carbamate kinase [Candidatus Krumholzibacteria bacterium]